MKLLENYTSEELNEKKIRYLSRDTSENILIYKDKNTLYYFEPVNIIKEEGFPFFDSNNCEKYKLIKQYKLIE